jgi:hypothetical protein
MFKKPLAKNIQWNIFIIGIKKFILITHTLQKFTLQIIYLYIYLGFKQLVKKLIEINWNMKINAQ